MARFSYQAFQADGASISGTVDARDEVQALEIISARGLTPVDVQAGSQKGPWWSRELSFSGATSVKAKDLEAFFESFSTLLNAQLPLPRALSFCESQTRNPELKQSLAELRSDIENGQNLATSLSAQEKVIPERLQSMLRLGESSNTLHHSVARAAALLKSEADIRRDLRSAMVYPIILLIMSMLVLLLIIFYLAPTLGPVFATAGSAPPPILRSLLLIEAFLTTQPLTALVSFVGMALVLIVLQKQIVAAFTRASSKIPVIGAYHRNRETLRLCQTLDVMLAAGATLPEALMAAEDATPSVKWQSAISEAKLEIEAGGTLAGSLDSFQGLNPMALSLIRAGEESDALGAMLASATSQLENETRMTLQQALRLLTPALTLFIGGMIGFLIISTISAILDLNDIAF